jgi:pimeloyl-ACP methyl ester carboxylesterase
VTSALLISYFAHWAIFSENARPGRLAVPFELLRVDVGEATLRVRRGGEGPSLLLLHGHPQTHLMWHAVAPGLAERFTVVAPDLRGYGESSKPATTDDHEPYSKRAMARDQVGLMRRLGFDSFSVCGHDRGARCAEVLEDYLRCARRRETIHAMCEDYRAGATFDRGLDEADRGKRRIECPVLVLWGGRGKLAELRRRAGDLARLGGRRPRAGARLRALPRRGGARGDARRAARVLRPRVTLAGAARPGRGVHNRWAPARCGAFLHLA